MIVKKNKDEIISFFSDAANFKGEANAVFFPENKSDVKEILRKANAENFGVTISGAGTGLTGGRVPEGGAVLATEKLNRIIDINATSKTITVESGVSLTELKKAVSEKGLFYPPDPTENDCFIGGAIATNASGAKSFKYGATRNFVTALEIILPTGDEIALRRGENFADKNKLTLTTENGRKINLILPRIKMPETKHAAGYFIKPGMDAIDLFIGAEGTLGVVTKAELRLLEKPQKIVSSVVFFFEAENALDFIAEARKKSYEKRAGNKGVLDALALEYFDRRALSFLLEDFPNIKRMHNVAVWFEQDISSENEDAAVESWLELIDKYGGDAENSWFAVDEKKREEFREFRHAVSRKISDFIARKNLRKVGTDTAVPHENFKRFYHFSEKLVEESALKFVIYGHFGDSHMHLNMLPANENELREAKRLYKIICMKAVELGGTVSAEHGIGKIKREYFELMYSENELREMAKIKKTLDPNLILNFGNIFSKKYYI